MKLFLLQLLIITMLSQVFTSCSDSPKIEQSAKANINLAAKENVKVYVFKKEQKAEIWVARLLTKSLNLTAHTETLAIGVYQKEEAKSVLSALGIPQNGSNSQLFVFPNDSRIDGILEACFACPHSTAEIYAQLEMEIFLSSQLTK